MALSYQAMLKAVKAVVDAGNVPNIVGDAGIGKSALVADLARQEDARLFTTVVSLSEKGDLAIPVPPLRDESFVQTSQHGTLANIQFGYSETLVDIIRWAEAHPQQPIIWFLDEFNRGTQAVQSELMNLVLQRQINSLRLPAQVHIIIAENPDSSMDGFADSGYAVTPSDAAIKDRTVRLVMKASLNDWLQWAQGQDADGKSRIQPLVIAYLQEHPDQLNDPDASDLGPTPRAWQRVSANLAQLKQLPAPDQRQLMADVFSGDLGVEVGAAFASFVLSQATELTVDQINSLSPEQLASRLAQVSQADRLIKAEQWLQQVGGQVFNQADQRQRCLVMINQLSEDASYEFAMQLGKMAAANPADLQKCYQAAQQGDDEAANFYRQLSLLAVKY